MASGPTPEELWSYFQKFSSKQVAGLVNECGENQKFCWYKHHAKHPYVKPYGVNSGVMLMNLQVTKNEMGK